MDESEIIRQLRAQNEQLRLENELLKAKIRELEARLAQYENAHTPQEIRKTLWQLARKALRHWVMK